MNDRHPGNQKMWLWVTIGVLLAIVAILVAIYRDAMKHPPKRTESELVGTPS